MNQQLSVPVIPLKLITKGGKTPLHNVLFRTCFEQGVRWHSGKHRVSVHSETGTWHDKNIQSIYHESELDCRNSFF